MEDETSGERDNRKEKTRIEEKNNEKKEKGIKNG